MTIKKYLYTALCVLAVLQFSCNKDFLDRKPLGDVNASDTWGDAALSEAFVTNTYGGLGLGGFNEQMLASLTDEATFTHTGRNINTVNEGSASATNPGWVNGTYEWESMYNWIRPCNVALKELETATFEDADLKDRLKGESLFLRAYYYQQLMRHYGGVPLIDRAYELNEDYTAARNTFEETINFIVKDCDDAYALLNGKSIPKGRATPNAALALKARVLLYAASDLHDLPTAKSKSTVISGYANGNLIAYESGDRMARWTAAKNAAKAVMDAAGTGYKLDLTAPASAEDAKMNYMSIAMGGGSTAPGIDASAESELIFARYFIGDKDEGGSWQGLYNGPNGYNNWAGNSPIGLLVDDYEMMDGEPFEWSNPAHKAAPYKNREPRFYATILYDGADWKPRPGTIDPANQIQTGSYDLVQDGATAIWRGLDTRQSPIEDWNGSRSGYYVRKFIDPNPSIVDNNTRQFLPWPFFRYTEMVFNYIEACIELGEEGEAVNWLNKIRYRAGMPAVTETGAALKERYQHERRLELAYEEHRYYDARRWMIAPATLGRKLTFISVTGKFKPGKTATTYKHDETIWDYTYNPVTDQSHENRKWDDKMYFVPIHQDEINRNDKLEQNPGY
ncbi:MAG: RagB/SusD family nutrient uptake outer membrane protein [Agriterribacter sp.]